MCSVVRLRLLLPHCVLLVSLLFFYLVSLSAQDSSRASQVASLLVVVSDPSGAVVPNAEVAFRGGKNFTTETRQDGSVQVGLPYGSYLVTIARPGFKTTKIIGFQVHVPRPNDLNVVLELGHYCDDCCDDCVLGTGVQTLTSDLPNVIEPNMTMPFWSWFGDCENRRYIGLEVMLGAKIIYHSSCPICPVGDRTNATEGQPKTVAFPFRGGYVFQGEYRTTRRDTIEGNIWQAGTDPGTILLGVSFSAKKQVLLNTIHVAKVDAESILEIDRGLMLRTFPTRRPK